MSEGIRTVIHPVKDLPRARAMLGQLLDGNVIGLIPGPEGPTAQPTAMGPEEQVRPEQRGTLGRQPGDGFLWSGGLAESGELAAHT